MAKFKASLDSFITDFICFTDDEKNLVIERILLLCGPQQLHLLSDELPNLVKRDFIRFLPVELALDIVRFLDYQTIGQCCMVSKSWNKLLSSCSDIWAGFCDSLGVLNSHKLATIDTDWKFELQEGLRRLKRLKCKSSFVAERILTEHVEYVMGLCYKNGLLASGSQDRSVRLWDVQSGVCKYRLTCHTCSDLQFDNTQVITGSFDNTLARWEWKTGNCLTKYHGHVGAVFSVDYNVELDMVISGSSDQTVKFWQMSTGSCLATKLGHQNWIISVLFAQIAQEFQTKLQRKYVVISMSKDCIKIWSASIAEEYGCIATLSSSSAACPVNEFLPKLLCNGRDIICSSNKGVCIWNLQTFQLTRLFQKHGQHLVAFGTMFALCWKNNKLRVFNNKTEECLYEMESFWSSPGSRYTDCAGETDWLSDCSTKLEHGPIYFAQHAISIVIVQWSIK